MQCSICPQSPARFRASNDAQLTFAAMRSSSTSTQVPKVPPAAADGPEVGTKSETKAKAMDRYFASLHVAAMVALLVFLCRVMFSDEARLISTRLNGTQTFSWFV